MLKKQYMIIALLSAGLAMTACTKKPAAKLSSSDESTSTQSYGVNQSGQFQGESSLYTAIKNEMKAPRDQTYYFSFDGSRTNASDINFIILQGNYLLAHPNAKVRLEGNTDNRGSREYNIGLGWRRDNAVARILQQQGVKPSQINMISLGKEKPAVLGNNEKVWQLNRRVRLVYEEK
jgi:peptidoglycan-associated lipoprotein